MTSKKVVIGIVVVIVIVIVIFGFMSRSGFYDGAIFDYTSPTMYNYNYPGVYYENGMACGSENPMLGWRAAELKRAAANAEAIALRQSAMVHEAKRRGAQYREMAAERDMKREAAIKRAAENESLSLQAMAKRHEDIAAAETAMSAQASAMAQTAGSKITSLGATKMTEMNNAIAQRDLARMSMLNAANVSPGCGRTMLM
jgi:hypothetical protein